MLRLARNSISFFALQLISFCASQTTPTPLTTSTTSTTAASSDFYAVTRTDIYALLIVAIGCPLCIAILCFWQKRKTKQSMVARQRVIDKRMGLALRDKQLLMHRQQIELQKQQSQQRQHAMSVPSHMHPNAVRSTQAPAAPLTKRTAALPSTATAEGPSAAKRPIVPFSNRTEKAIPPKNFSAPPSTLTLVSTHTDEDIFKPAPPPGPPPDDAPTFMKVESTGKVQTKKDILSALELPVIENDVTQSPPTEKPKAQRFHPKTGAPQLPPVMVPLKSNESDSEEEPIPPPPDPPQEERILQERNSKTDDNVTPIEESSSGEAIAPLASSHDKLLSPQDQMAAQPMPSLQTIFGRRVENNDEESSEDSLLKRQLDFAANPDTPVISPNVLDANEEPFEAIVDNNENQNDANESQLSQGHIKNISGDTTIVHL